MFRSLVLCLVSSLGVASSAGFGQQAATPAGPVEAGPNSAVLDDVRKHFPDVATASAKALENEGDLLRVRHYPKEALGFYQAVLARFGETPVMLNKMGMAHMELNHVVLAESYFRRALQRDGKYWEGWNNLASVAYLQRRNGEAENGYKKAIKLTGNNTIAHVNLCRLYFEMKRYEKAVGEAREAMRMDAKAFDADTAAPMTNGNLSAVERARGFYEVAQAFARHGLEAEMRRELKQAQKEGIDLLAAIPRQRLLSEFGVRPAETAVADADRPHADRAAANFKISSVNPHTGPLAAVR